MGALIYGPGSVRLDIDDYQLTHLQFVIIAKLRRRESFAVTVSASESRARISVWLNDAIPLVFEYSSTERHSLDRGQIDAMMIEAVSSAGLRVDVWEREQRELFIVD